MSMNDFSELYAVPGANSIIDAIDPSTGLTFVNGDTEDDVKARHPRAVRMTWDAWQMEKARKQNAPIAWEPIDSERYHELLNCLPPIGWNARGYLVGEPTDHCVTTGRPRFQACIQRGAQFFASNRPMTIAEWTATSGAL